jgi:hypothetical protein
VDFSILPSAEFMLATTLFSFHFEKSIAITVFAEKNFQVLRERQRVGNND